MKNRTLQDLLDLHGKCLMSGKFNQILACYQEVLPLFLDGKAILIDGPPQIMLLAVDFHEDLVQVPPPAARSHPVDTAFPDLSCKHWAEPKPPVANGFVAHIDAALVQQIFDVLQ